MTSWMPQIDVVLAAVGELPRVWGRFDHQRPSFDWGQALLVAGAMTLGIAAVFVWHRLTGRSSKDFAINSPGRLFRELARAHKLSNANRRLLKRLALARGLANPTLLFVEPKHFGSANLPEDLKPHANDLRQIHRTLFGGSAKS